MKNLMIDDKKKAFYRIKNNEEFAYESLEKITPSGIKSILTDAYNNDEFMFDILQDDEELSNPVENVIYKHLNSKLKDIRDKRIASIKEHDSYYQKIMDEYKLE
jgi:hypothetical protein